MGEGKLQGAPGPGGSLGACGLCGKDFALEVIRSLANVEPNIRTVRIEGFEGEFCLHDKCYEELEVCKGKSWNALPEGPLRTAFEKYGEEEVEEKPDE